MKKYLCFLIAFLPTLVIFTSAHAQFKKGDMLLNPGLSFGLIGYTYSGYGTSSFALPVTANFEYSITDQVAVGGYLGYFSRSYTYSSNYKDRFSVVSFGARGTFHADKFLNEQLGTNVDMTKWDFYGALLLGYENYHWKYDSNFIGSHISSNAGRVILGPVIGARYFVSPNFGVYGEVGRGTFGLLTLGASFKF